MMKSSYTSHLIPEMANSLLPTPNLLQIQKRFLLPLALRLSLRQFGRKHTMLRMPRLFHHQGLSPSYGHNQSQKTSSSQRHRHQHLR